MMEHTAVLTIGKSANIDYRKILGNMREHKRSTISIKETGTALSITIKTRDITALRASVNAIMRDIQVVKQSLA